MRLSWRPSPFGLLLCLLLVAGAFAVVTAQQEAFEQIDRDDPAISYEKPSHDPVATLLQTAIPSRLVADGPSGYLAALLRSLDIPQSSQILVFSKGSVQSRLIAANNPRALYFNESVVVGWVRGGFIEIAAQDPRQGTVFYKATPGSNGLAITRSDECLSCHHTARTAGVVGVIEPMTHARPLERRWGGWYVTGDAGSVQHNGNVDIAALASGDPFPKIPRLMSLEHIFDTRGYLSPESDIVALMVFEHQMQMMNLLTRLGWETQLAMRNGRLPGDGREIEDIVNRTADYMLFVDEASIPAPITGASGFAEAFGRLGPRDAKGRTLRELDLTRRLFRYPCSFMIYSAQFEQLPTPAKTALYRRLWTILSAKAGDARYKRLSAVDRQAIVEIIRATKTDVPAFFRA
jgi:hypothetical protein